MNPLHYKAAHWVREGLFDDLKSFVELETRINSIFEEKDRGDVFEIFIEGYLATQPITQWVKHWMVGSIPLEMRERYNLPNDGTGIDGIYEIHDGSHVAYQVKYRKNHNLTFAEVSPFLGITEKFSDRVIFTNASKLSNKAVARTRWYSNEAFNALGEAQFKKIEAWLKEKPAPITKATPDPSYQVQTLSDIDATFKKNARATVVMACGTGKTLLALWAAEQAKPKTVLVLLPSLTLLQQTLHEWSEQNSWGSKFSYLGVCSDKTVGLKNDSLNIDTSDVGFRVDTDPLVVRQFLEQKTDNVKIIFSTYHSTDVVAEGSKGLAPFDLGIFDEAHKTTGQSDTYFSSALYDENVQINKRLFLTATPRHIDIRKRDKEGEFRVQSMDDETIYGPRAHTLSFGAAASKGIICRYKVIVSLIDKQMVDDFTRKNGITLVEGDEIGARWVANLIALDQAAKKVDAKKIITFHSRVKSAEDFAKDEPRGIAYHLKGYDVRHVNGGQNSGERSQLIGAFANSIRGLITNARCLTEGVNIPAVDMVAFIDPRQSKVDITQAVGRAMRKPRSVTTKTVGYVLVPLFAGMEGESLDEAIETEKFDAIADVLNALQEHDEELVDIISELKQKKGEDAPFNPKRLLEKIEFIGPVIGFDDLVQSISVAISDKLGSSWDENYGRLVKFKEREGNCLVPDKHIEDGFRLSAWVARQRSRNERLSEEQRQRLDELGFIWDAHAHQWEEGFSALLKFKEREGSCLVSQKHLEGGYRLGKWISGQRTNKEKLSEDRSRRLDELGFVWNPKTQQWEEGFSALKKFKEREGNCLVPATHNEDGYRLGKWVGVQRTTKEMLTEDRRRRLDELGFVWDPITQQWEEGFSALLKFKGREGNCLISAKHLEDGYRLGQWVSRQRTNKEKLSEEQRRRLDELGFVWDPHTQQWEEGYSAFLKFKEREGNCLVSQKHLEDGYRLGTWVGKQRSKKESLSEDRYRRLDELGFVWDPITQQWEDGFSSLKQFKEREGHCLVPVRHLEDGYRLGQWVDVQRTKKNKIPEAQRRRLDEQGFVWYPHAHQWEEGFSLLLKFKEREGNCLVPSKHREDGYRLGKWVNRQRTTKEELTEERRHRLDELGFVWDAIAQLWEEGFSALLKFKEREGNCLVSDKHREDGYRLGKWISGQRTNKEKLSEDRYRRLDELGFVWESKKNLQWEDGFRALIMFKEREGNCLVPSKHREDGYRLGKWVSHQRTGFDDLPKDRRRRLDELGFVWKVK